MAATSGVVRRLPAKKDTKKRATEAARPTVEHKGPDVVINRVEVSISLAAPFMFGVPLRLVDWMLERLGLITDEEISKVIDPTFEGEDEEPEPVPVRRSQLHVRRPAARAA